MQATNSATTQVSGRLFQLEWFKDFSFAGCGFYLLLLTSGFCGISYEILYARVLGNLLGDQMIVSASILMTFLLGIGIGTRYAYRLWRWLWAIELGIGLCGIFFAFGTPLLDGLLFRSGAVFTGSMTGSVLVAVALLTIPSALIGCSLPLFAGYLSRLKEGSVFAKAYTVYNIGAAITALLIEFWLVRTFGLQGALLSIAALNIFVGVMLAKQFGVIRRESPTDVDHVKLPWNHKLAIVLVSVGSAVFQLMMIKVAECLFGPFHETFALVLATVLLGIAVGSIAVEKLRLEFDVVVCAAVFGLGWFLWGFDSVAQWYAANYSIAVDDYWQLVLLKTKAIACLMGIPAVAFGAVVPAMLQNQKDVARESGELLFVSSMANALGFLLMAFVLHRALTYGMIVVAVASLSCTALLIRYGLQLKLLAAAAALLLMVFGSHGKIWDENLLYMGHTSFHSTDEIEETRQELKLTQVFKGHQDIFAITTIDDEDYFFINGYISIPLSSPSERIVGAYSSIFAPRTDQALVLGVGSGATAGTVGQIFDHTTAVEINPVILDNLFRMSEYNFDIEDNPNVDIVLDDGIHFVKADQKKYSLVINTVTTPLYFSSSKLYTHEFLKHVRHRLTDDGVYVTWFDGRVGDRGLDIVLNTIRKNFKHCMIGCVKAEYFLLMCSDTPIRAHHPDVVSRNARLAEHFYREHDFNPDWFAYGVLCADAYELISNKNERINTLNYPALEFEMSRLRGYGIDGFIDRLTQNMSIDRQRLVLEPHVKWNPNALLLHVDELLGDSYILDRWQDLIEVEYPEAYEQSRLMRLAKLDEKAKSSDTAEAYFDYGFELLELKEHELAIEKFEVVLQKDAMYNDAHYNLGTCYENLERFEDALKHYELELQLHDDQDAHYRIGRSAIECGQFAKAAEAMRRALEIEDESDGRVLLAKALTEQGHVDRAIAELRTAIELNSDNADARAELRRLLELENRSAASD